MFEDMTPLAMAAGAVTWALVLLAYPSQVYEMWKKKSSKGVSLLMFVVGFFAFFIWIFYGWEIKNYIVVASNILGTILSGIIIAQTIYYRRKESDYKPFRQRVRERLLWFEM